MVKTNNNLIEINHDPVPPKKYNVNFPLGDALIRIKNAYRANLENLFLPNFKMIKNVLNVLKTEGYIESYSEFKDNPKWLFVILRAKALLNLKLYSTPSKQIYVKRIDIPKLYNHNFGVFLISTNRGIMSHMDAFSQNLGGKVLAEFI